MKTFCILVGVVLLCSPSVTAQWYTIVGDILVSIVNLSSLQTWIFPRYSDTVDDKDVFDFVIVGAGPAGSALANRLSENSNISVLLLEYGEEPSKLTDVPAVTSLVELSKYSYCYATQPQEGFCKGCENNGLYWTGGKALGGSTVTNVMMVTRGNRRDFDRWAAAGNPGWSYDDLLPYFKKIEDCQVNTTDASYRGRGGFVTVSDLKYRSKITDVFVKACVETGVPYNEDHNGKEQMGVGYIQGALRDGFRCSAEKAYLRPVRKRKNLKIQTKSKVTRILIHSVNKTAYGVEYIHSGTKKYAYAKKEVILSAGTLKSPQLLILSGIGPKEELEELGIPLIKDLPVGSKIYDHAAFAMVMFELNQSISDKTMKDYLNPATYFETIDAAVTSIGIEAVSFLKTNVSDDPDPLFPDIELLFMPGSQGSDFGTANRKLFNIPPDTFDKFFAPYTSKQVYQILPVLIHPKSHGHLKLNKTDPLGSPLFYPNFLSHPHDVQTFIAGIRIVQKISKAPAFQKYGAKMTDIPVPGCEDETFDSDEYWECALKSLLGTFWHMVATCKMGPSNDTEAVVDSQLRVYGVKGLRVVDASIIPMPPSAHTMAMTYVIGEKSASMIKEFWGI